MQPGGAVAFESRRLFLWAAALVSAAAGFAVAAGAQQTGSGLVVHIEPEAHLSPLSATLSFTVANPGGIVASDPVAVNAWVRALPGQQILVTALASDIVGPFGRIGRSALAWTGIMQTTTGGAATATCTSGSFEQDRLRQLISNWNQSGIARCTVVFSLTTQPSWPAGAYSGRVDFALSTH